MYILLKYTKNGTLAYYASPCWGSRWPNVLAGGNGDCILYATPPLKTRKLTGGFIVKLGRKNCPIKAYDIEKRNTPNYGQGNDEFGRCKIKQKPVDRDVK